MLETVRQIAAAHIELVKKFGPGCSGFVCDNAKLRAIIAEAVKDPAARQVYLDKIAQVRTASASSSKKVSGRKLKEQQITPPDRKDGDNRTAMRASSSSSPCSPSSSAIVAGFHVEGTGGGANSHGRAVIRRF